MGEGGTSHPTSRSSKQSGTSEKDSGKNATTLRDSCQTSPTRLLDGHTFPSATKDWDLLLAKRAAPSGRTAALVCHAAQQAAAPWPRWRQR